jgi:F-type H+-transporting ATPase subunit b
MLRRSILAFGTGILAGILLLVCAPVSARSAPQPEGHGGLNAEAEPGHTAGAAGQGAEPARPAAGGEERPNPMKVEPTLTLWTIVVFVALLLLLSRFAWKPLAHALHQREEHLEHCLLQTEKARNESEELLAEHRRLMAQADDRVRALIDQAHKDASAGAEEIIKAAHAQAEAARDRAQRDIATARDQALAEIWSQTANVAVSVAGRVLAKDLSADEHRRLLDLAIKELPASSASTNGHGGQHA